MTAARLRQLFPICLAIFLSACSSTPSSPLGELPRTPQATTQQLLQQADASDPEEARLLRLSAADQSFRQGDQAQARRIMEQVPLDALKPAQQIFASTLLAELAMADNRPDQALAAIQHPSFQWLAEMPPAQQIRSHLIRARTFEANKQAMTAIRERVFLAPLLNAQPTQAKENHEAIWSQVSILPIENLQPTGETDLDGWLSLAAGIRQAGTLSLQQTAIGNWQKQNPKHPAARQLPEPLVKLLALTERPVDRVALLLPTQGQLANVAQAIRNGFLTAHLQAQQTGQALPYIKLYDSSRITSLDAFYQQAQADGMQLVIGPLEKDLVRQLGNRQQLPITTLALNYGDIGQRLPPQLFQFGLAAEDEAREVARQAWVDGHRNAIALVPAGDWGNRVLAAFRQSWQDAGGTVVAAEPLAQPVALAQQIANLLKLHASAARDQQAEGTTGQAIASQPARRQGADFLFLTATPQQAQQVNPTLAYQNAGDIPVYATSHVYAANNNPSQFQDLEGIRFTETPWLLNTQQPLRQQAERQWPQAGGSLGRLYAMGADAYLLAPLLNQLAVLPSTQLDGLSGRLSLGPQQRIVRTLSWAEFRNGTVVPLATTGNSQ
ncbi:penicillin-binding protein activator [Azomonas macrocytogenes]|uniref:Penicillin-binding protein activator n=1 Tax=Azomonas macrocytogenes TaxID=69962 RepID=A0A839T549_AZOMA|nr:penicillin-binding protein activator [Azomonas macrocytogenes]MBB3104651.1 hypothetical protein [Azomonas macrocytogenes]